MKKRPLIKPVTTVDNFYHDTPRIVIHSHINHKGKMHLSKEEAMLLIADLWEFVNSQK